MLDLKDGQVGSHTHNGITTIEFYHPQSNSLPSKILESLRQEIHFAGTHDETRVIVLKSDGEKTFCAGASFDELVQISTIEEATKFFAGFANLINTIRNCPKFIIARVQGKCVGGGVGIAAAADYAIAYKDASIKLSELSVGFGPFVIGPVVERKIGSAAFIALSVDALMWRDSDWAKKKGLFAEVHENISNMDESILRLATNLANSSPVAMSAMKKMFWQGTENWDDLLMKNAAISASLLTTEFAKNAIAKFKAKIK